MDRAKGAMLRVEQPGTYTLVEDLGRPGFAHLGVSGSGALDRGALRLANRLVGNRENAAGFEILLGGCVLRSSGPLWVAVTGAWGAVRIRDRDGAEADVAPNRATFLEAGSTISFGPADHGLRFYLAVRGGLQVPMALGSASADQLSGLGPARLLQGDTLDIGEAIDGPVPPVDFIPFEPPTGQTATVGVFRGPRQDWFAAAAVARFFDEEWVVGADSNRIGLRLEASRESGAVLERVVPGELPSEAMIAGAIQVPPSGAPTVLLADHPVTGGYPVIAVVADTSLDLFAQLRPGQRVSFRHA